MMNVVGRFGNLITQGVLAFAIPFHPFGGAIDVIVVQHEDGTFRSTPWHVQFGKFQGVLKGAEKVRVTVNGVEAGFHMYLDSSGEAYFVREVDPTKGSGGVEAMGDLIIDDRTDFDGRKDGNQDVLDSCVQENGVFDASVQMQEESSPLYSERNETAESDGKGRSFQDEESCMDSSVEMLDDRSNQYTDVEVVKSHDEKSEIVLGSVNGYEPTDPISASKKSMEKVRLTPTQNCRGCGDGMDFGEGNEKSNSGEDPQPRNCNHLNGSKSGVDLYYICSANSDTDVFEYQLEVCEGDEHVFHSQNHVDITSGGDTGCVSNSLLERPQHGQLDSEDVSPLLVTDNSEAEGIENPPRVDETVEESVGKFIKKESSLPSGHDFSGTCTSPDLPVMDNLDQNDQSVYFDSHNTQLKNDQVNEAVDHEDGGLERSVSNDKCSESEFSGFRVQSSNERIDSQQTTSKLLFAGSNND